VDWFPRVAFVLLCAVTFVAVCTRTGWHFVYTLDDPYIHLALAENIARGVYGINLQEASAPSSSILWPLLLALGARTGWLEYWPLGINLVCGTLATELIARFLRTLFSPRSLGQRWTVSLAALLVAVCVNLVGLVFSGMEHCLQLLLVTLALHGLLLEARDGRLRLSCTVALALAPLVRYESFVLSGPLLVYLALRGHRRAAGVGLALSLGTVGAFSLFLVAQRLGPLPNSVLAKAQLMHGSLLDRLSHAVLRSWEDPRVVLFWLLVVVLAVCAVALRPAAQRLLALAFAGATLGHLFIGNFGWFSRYELYMWCADSLALIWLCAEPVASLGRMRATRIALLAAVGGLLLSGPYVATQLKTAAAARNIFEQQYQLHRFVTELYPKPVAVNDLGWVSFGNDAYVLDLVGLGSREALLANLNEPDSRWKQRLALKHNVDLAMVYELEPDSTPDAWTRLGTLHLAGPLVTCADDEVVFFATRVEAVAELRGLLAKFARGLPSGVKFVPAHSDARSSLAPAKHARRQS
jgi:hypothetical protein